MFENEVLGVNESEVAELTDKGVNEPEVAEPDVVEGEEKHKNTPHEAWMEMRKAREEAERRASEAERKVAEMEAAANARNEALRRLTGNENAEIAAIAESIGVDPEDIMATLNAEQESAKKDLVIAQLQEQLESINAEAEMQKDLAVLQRIDPELKDIATLGKSYVNYINAGLSAEEAYYAVKAKEINTKDTPPAVIGKVDNRPPEKDYFTEAEVDAMTPSQQKANAEKILASMGKW